MGLEVALYRVRALNPRCLGKHTVIADSEMFINAPVVAYDLVGFRHTDAY
jgi:hypothetical protein